MSVIKTVAFSFIFAYSIISSVCAEETPLQGMKLGFGFDQGFSVVASLGGLNGAPGDDGVALDYVLMKDELKIEVSANEMVCRWRWFC